MRCPQSRVSALIVAIVTALIAMACSTETSIDLTEAGTLPTPTPTATPSPPPTATPLPTATPTATPTPPPTATPLPTATPDVSPLLSTVIEDTATTSLIEDCRDTGAMACDILLSISERESALERYAFTCGDRDLNPDGFCTPQVEPNGEDSIWFDDDQTAIDDIAGMCERGDMTACDFLFFRSDFGSRWEEFGNTCAGRTETAEPNCRETFPELG